MQTVRYAPPRSSSPQSPPAVALSGCSATVTGSPAPTGAVAGGGAVAPTNDPVAWTDKRVRLVAAVHGVGLATTPQLDQNDPTAATQALSAYLGKSESAIDQSLPGSTPRGPSPVADRRRDRHQDQDSADDRPHVVRQGQDGAGQGRPEQPRRGGDDAADGVRAARRTSRRSRTRRPASRPTRS